MRAMLATLAALGAVAAAADEAVILMPAQLAGCVEVGERWGRQVAREGDGKLVTVTVSQTLMALPRTPTLPLVETASCADPTALDVPSGFRVPVELDRAVGGGSSALDAMEHVVAWTTRHVRVRENDDGPQDAVSVLGRRRGRCSGRANVAVGLLRALGVPARVVHGVVVGPVARWHRWGEAWLGPVGWVPFDPGASVGAVSVRYLPMAGAGEGTSLADVTVVRLDERGLDALPKRSGLHAVSEGGATIRCQAPAGGLGLTAVLTGPDGSVWARYGVNELVFAGLVPGVYQLRWEGGAVASGSARVAVPRGDEVRIMLGGQTERVR